MDAHIEAILAELYQEGQANDAHQEDRRQKMLNLEPETARFVSLLIRSSRRKKILEIGTSNGYSTLWLAWSAQQTDGHIISIDREPEKHTLAETNLREAGLHERVDLRCGDATEIVATLEGPFDCIFFDADRYGAPNQLALLFPRLTSDVLLLADNVLSHPAEIAGYLAAVQSLPDFEHMVIPVGKGLSVAYRAV